MRALVAFDMAHNNAATTAPPPTRAVAMLSGKPKAMCACLFLTGMTTIDRNMTEVADSIAVQDAAVPNRAAVSSLVRA